MTNLPKVSAIIAAYNEAPRLPTVLDVLTASPLFSEVIVVDDASTDDTVEVMRRYAEVKYLKQPSNKGKAQAIDRGVQAAREDIIFLCDADLNGLTEEVLQKLIVPVQRGEVLMCAGIRGRRVPALINWLTNLAPRITAFGGERALQKSLWQRLPMYYKHGYRLEIGLNFYATPRVSYVLCPSLRQKIKEQKYGFAAGFVRRLVLVNDILGAIFYTYIFDRRRLT